MATKCGSLLKKMPATKDSGNIMDKAKSYGKPGSMLKKFSKK